MSDVQSDARGARPSWMDSAEAVNPRRVITMDDFITGLIAALAGAGVENISMRDAQFIEAVAASYMTLAKAAPENVTVNFTVAVNDVYGDSPDIRQAITRAVQRDLVSLDNPHYQRMTLKIGRGFADQCLATLPGAPDLYRDAAKEFLTHYPNYA